MSTPIVNPVPLPSGDPLTQPKKPFDGRTLDDVIQFLRKGLKGWITDTWSDALDQQAQTVAAAPVAINRVSESDLNAAVATTDLAGASLASGLYEVRTYQQIITPAGVSSSIQVTIGWTYNGVVQSLAFAAVTGNLTTSFLTGPAMTFRSDAATPITYAVAYASNPAGAMLYNLDLVLSRVAS